MNKTGADRVITFPEGIPGFEEVKQFRLNTEDDDFLAWMEAADTPEIRFFMIHPQLFFPDYLLQVDLNSGEMESLEITPGDSVDVWAIVTVCAGELTKSTVNLRAPLLLNPRTNKGIQLILSDDEYSSQQLMFTASLNTEQDQNYQEGAGK